MKKIIIVLCILTSLDSISQERTKQFSGEAGIMVNTTAVYTELMVPIQL